MIDVDVNQGAVDAMLLSEAGPVAAYLTVVTESVVLPEARDALAIPAIRWNSNRLSDSALSGPPGIVSGRSGTTRNTWAPNPPPGPPYRRTGDLIASLGVHPPTRDEKGLVVYGTATARHGGWLYPEILIQRGYRFLPLGDPRFIYDDVTI